MSYTMVVGVITSKNGPAFFLKQFWSKKWDIRILI